MKASTGMLSHVDGSSLFESCGTKVICSVSGPIEAKSRQELPTQMALEIIVKPAAGVQNTREKLIEDQIRAVLTPVLARYMHPRQLVQIAFQVLESGEAKEYTVKEVSACVNAGVLALVDAGIPLLSMCSSAAVSVGSDGSVTLDPTSQDLCEADSVHVMCLQLATDSQRKVQVENVLLLDSLGTFDESVLGQVLESGEKECIRLYGELRSVVQDKISRDFVWRE